MSNHELQPYESTALSEPTDAFDAGDEDSSQGATLPGLWRAMSRRWRTILLVWLLTMPAFLAAVWLLLKPRYTATAMVEILPVVPAILYQDPTPIMPNYESYLNTQAEVVAGRAVLTAALSDPSVRELPLQAGRDPVASLHRALTVRAPSRTQLLEISVQQETPEAALRLTRAVLDAYIGKATGADSQTALQQREALHRQRDELRLKLAGLNEQIRQRAEQAGTGSGSVFELRQQGLEKSIADARQRLDELDLSMQEMEAQLRQLDAAVLPEDLASQREQMIDADSGVAWVAREIASETAKLARMRLGLPAGHKDIAAVEKSLDHLQAELDRERVRAARTADREVQRKLQQRIQDAHQRLSAALAAARQRRQTLAARMQDRDAEGMKVGRQGLDLQALTRQRDATQADFDRVAEAMKKLEIESQRSARIGVANPPEIRPDGIKDRRKKLSLVVVLLTLGLACGAGLLKDLADPRVYASEPIGGDTKLRMLGAVPSARELQAGRITKEHFLESYRLIRASLSSLGADSCAPRSILITSAQAAEGKTSLAVSLAISLAEPGCRVLLIDGDIQAPQIGRLLEIHPRGNLRQVLQGQAELGECVSPSAVPGLDVLTGHGNGETTRTLLNMRCARDLITAAVSRYDHVVVDSPPALGAADSLVWAHAVEGVIVTSLAGYSDRKAIKLACRRLTSVGARLLGSVMANVSITESYYSYSTTSCRGEGSLALPHRGGPARRTPPLVHLPQGTGPAAQG